MDGEGEGVHAGERAGHGKVLAGSSEGLARAWRAVGAPGEGRVERRHTAEFGEDRVVRRALGRLIKSISKG